MSAPTLPASPSAAPAAEPRLTSLSHGGGCGCKIAPGLLSDILRQHMPLVAPPQLMVGTETSDDAAVWRLSDTQALVATTDFFMPIVDDPRDFGDIAATNAISDVYAMGARPLLALALVGMPIGVLGPQTIGRILRGGQEACARAGIPIAGGHSIDSVEPIYGLAVIGLGHPERIRRNRDAREGDLLVLGKGLGVGILSAALKKDRLDAAGYRTMLEATTRLNTPGPLLAGIDGVQAMTDVTGFGLLGHALELCRGAALGATIRADAVPLLPQVRELAAAGLVTGASGRNWNSYRDEVELHCSDELAQSLFTDPQTAGGLLVSCSAEALPRVLDVFRTEGFADATPIGSMHAGAPRLSVV